MGIPTPIRVCGLSRFHVTGNGKPYSLADCDFFHSSFPPFPRFWEQNGNEL